MTDPGKRSVLPSIANNEIRRLAFWDNFREFHAHNVYDASHYNGYVTLRDTVDSPPTYLDQPPFIGTVPPIPTAHQRLLAHPPNPHIIMTEGSSGLDSPPERSIDSGRSTVGVACGPLDMGTSTRD